MSSSEGHRVKIPDRTATAVLTACKRRCCICFAIDGVVSPTLDGQLAHLDRKRNNNNQDNIAYLCLRHHNQYDSTPSTTTGLRTSEVKQYRSELHHFLKDANWRDIIEIECDGELDDFTTEKETQLLQSLKRIGGLTGVIRIRSRRKGSVILESEIDRRDLMRLSELPEYELRELGIRSIRFSRSAAPAAPVQDGRLARTERDAAPFSFILALAGLAVGLFGTAAFIPILLLTLMTPGGYMTWQPLAVDIVAIVVGWSLFRLAGRMNE